MIKTVVNAAIFLAVVAVPFRVLASGFSDGHLLVSGSNGIYTIDPLTGQITTLFVGIQTPSDIVYNSVTDSAFLLVSSFPDSVILELRWDAVYGFQLSTFLSDLKSTDALAVDSAGNLYFNQSDFADRRMWRADLSGEVVPVSEVSNDLPFLTSRITFDPHENRLLATDRFDGVTEVVLANESVSTFNGFIVNPSGIDVAGGGTVYVMEHARSNFESEGRITLLNSHGEERGHIHQPWMDSSFFLGDLEYDDRDGSIYVLASDGKLHVLDQNLTHQEFEIGVFSSISGGIDLIESPIANGLLSDFNNDGMVNGLDLAIWEVSFGNGVEADNDSDGDVDGADFLIWQRQVGSRVGLFASSTSIPEPCSCTLLMLAIVGIFAFPEKN